MNKPFQITLFIFTLAFSPILAQQELSLHFVRNIWQANLTNPALSPAEKKMQIMLPSIYYNVNSPDFTINELLKPDANGVLSLKDLVNNRLKDRNRIDGDIQFQTVGLSYSINENLQINAFHGVNGRPNVDVADDVIKLLLQGNSQFLGKTAIFDSYANGSMYGIYGLGASYKINDNFSIGGRVKLLQGIAGIFTTSDNLSATFDPVSFQITMDNDIDVKTYNGDKLLDIRNTNDLIKNSFSSPNKGMSFDLGATMTLGKATFAASVIDLAGTIKWKNGGKGYASKGNYTFSGFSTDDLLNINNIDFNSLVDSVKQKVGFTETENPEYTQKLPAKLYLSTQYKMTDKVNVGLLVYTEMGAEKSNIATAFNTSMHISDNIELGATWAYRNSSAANIGINAVFSLGPVQIYAVTDNIINAIRPYDSKRSNGRLGLNLAF